MTEKTPDQISDQMFPDRSTGNKKALKGFAIDAARMLRDDKCEHIVLLDVSELSQVTDYIIIGTGTSQRQMASTLDHVEDLGKELGFDRHTESRDDRSLWLLADFVDVVVHLFEPNTRAHYDLEMLWGDAPRIEWDNGAPRTPIGARTAESEPVD
jgi:ribosome-associated protein